MKRAAVFYWLIGIAIAATLVVAAFYFDEAVQNFIVQHQNATLRNLMRNVSRFGDWPEHLVVGLVLAGIAWWRGSKKWTRIFLSMLLALALAGLAARVVKISAGRARPSVKIEELTGRSHFSSKYHSFPSGHVAASSGFFAMLLFASWRIGISFLTIPIVIGFSRIYIGAHYLSDVVCAAILGIICALLVLRVVLPRIENRKSAIEN